MKNIPFKPLSERMLEEPFWLGLITVTIVLIILGIGWFVKKHLPERLEKFFQGDADDTKTFGLEKASGIYFYFII